MSMANGHDGPVLIGVGANLRSAHHGPAVATCVAALAELERAGVRIVRRSRWFRAAPLPDAPVPWYVNGVAAVATTLPPDRLLELLLATERAFGRERTVVNAPRALDLDLLAWGDLVRPGPSPILPHPRMHERAFVLRPLLEVAPAWRHPVLGRAPGGLLERLWPGQIAEPFAAGA